MVISPFLKRVWKMRSARWGVQIAGMIFQICSSRYDKCRIGCAASYRNLAGDICSRQQPGGISTSWSKCFVQKSRYQGRSVPKNVIAKK